MADKIYQIAKSDVNEMNEKIQKHRRKILAIIASVVILLLIGLAGGYIYLQSKTYSNYEVLKTAKREDTEGAQFEIFCGNSLRYGQDGAVYMDEDNRVIWNQTYEMQEPMIDTCESYVTIAEKQGEKIYIMDTAGPCGEIETTMPIQRVKVANQGMVAILMEQDGTGYLQLYDRGGNYLAEGEVHTENSGYPLDIAISNDGKKLAVSLLDVKDGNIKNSITFFNFDSVGQNEIDNIVGQYSYADMVFPKVEFLTNNTMAAFGSAETVIFEGAQKPVVSKEITAEGEIRSIFYNDAYIGYVFESGKAKMPYRMQIFDLNGTEVLSQDFNIEYQEIGFLENDEVCIRNEMECAIYTLRGVEKFYTEFKQSVWKVMSAGGLRDYVLLMDGETQKIRLK